MCILQLVDFNIFCVMSWFCQCRSDGLWPGKAGFLIWIFVAPFWYMAIQNTYNKFHQHCFHKSRGGTHMCRWAGSCTLATPLPSSRSHSRLLWEGFKTKSSRNKTLKFSICDAVILLWSHTIYVILEKTAYCGQFGGCSLKLMWNMLIDGKILREML